MDRRDLRLLTPAVERFLSLAAEGGHGEIYLPLLAAGEGRNRHRSFSVIEIVRGSRRFAKTQKSGARMPSVYIHIVDADVLYRHRAGKLYTDENLYGDDFAFLDHDPTCP